MRRLLLFSLLVFACAGASAATLGVTPAAWMKSTGAPSATCSATVNNGIFDVSEALHIYQCSNNNVGATYQWNDLGGGGGCSGVTAGSYTSANITVNSAGCITAASNGTAGNVVWQRQPSPLIVPYPSDASQQVQEPAALRITTPEVLTGPGYSSVIGVLFTSGWSLTTGIGLCYGETPDGNTFTRDTTCPLTQFSGYRDSYLMANPLGSGFITYAYNLSTNAVDQFTGTTIVGQTLAHSGVVACGSVGTQETGISKFAVLYDSAHSLWRGFLDCPSSISSNTYTVWLYTSTNGYTWTSYQSTPVMGDGSAASSGGLCLDCSGTEPFLSGGVLYAWAHGGNTAGDVPTPYIYHMVDSTGVGNAWVIDSSYPLTARTAAEGVNLANGQIANISIVDMGALNETLAFFAEYANGCPGGSTCAAPSYIETAQVNLPLSSVETSTNQTDAPAPQGTPTILVNSLPLANNQLLNLQLGYVATPASPSAAGAAGQWSTGPGPSGHGYTYTYDAANGLWMQIEGSETWSPCTGYQAEATFIGTSGTAVSSYTDLCGKTFALYSNSGVTATIPVLSGSGSAVLSSGSYAAALSSLTPSSADYTVSGTFTLTSAAITAEQFLVFARASSGANTSYEWACAPHSGLCGLYATVAGSATQLGSNYSFTWATSTTHTLSLAVSGTSIIASIDGTAVITQTDSSISAAGQAGFRETPEGAISVFTVQ